MPRLPLFHAHCGSNAAHVDSVSAVPHNADQNGIIVFWRAYACVSPVFPSVIMRAVALVHVDVPNTNPVHRLSY